jgi:hypothetical protein
VIGIQRPQNNSCGEVRVRFKALAEAVCGRHQAERSGAEQTSPRRAFEGNEQASLRAAIKIKSAKAICGRSEHATRALRSERTSPQGAWRAKTLRAALKAGILAATIAATLAPLRASAGALDFRTADFNILRVDGVSVIGHAHFDVTESRPGFQVVTSEAHYVSGDYDIERDELDVRDAEKTPTMASFEHRFFRPGGAPFMLSKVDFSTGAATCISYPGGKANVITDNLDFPSDSYAGAAMILPLQASMRDGNNGPIELHDFACMPGPKLVKVEAYTEGSQRWNHYPGEVVRADIKPDFGWLDFLIAPFVPEMHAWFNPTDHFHFVGGQFTRFYKGPQIILARTN